MSGLRYLPRQQGFTNGVARQYRVEVRGAGEREWREVMAGEAPNREDRAALELAFPEVLEVEAFRFVIERDWSGGGFGTAAELVPVGVKLEPVVPVQAARRLWLEIPPQVMAGRTGKTLGVRASHGGGAAVILGGPRLERLHGKPTERLFGRSNGGLGPDKVGVGLLGFDAMVEHRQVSFSVLNLRAGTPAEAAGLRQGDVVVAVDGKALAVNDLDPGWNWLQHSHEARLGRALETALADGRAELPLTVMRDGAAVDLRVALGREAAFGGLVPAEDAEAAKMLADMIAFLERTQRDDGSWSRDAIRTTFSALALMATGEEKHLPRVARAVEWAMQRYPRPEAYGNLGFWAGGYIGKLYAEWHLATGDERVLPHMRALQDWAHRGHHRSKWDVPALGHGTDGLPYEDKALVAPACHLLLFEALALRCGLPSKIWDLLNPYMVMSWSDPAEGGNGSLGYNPSHKDLEEFWARSGMFAMVTELRGERDDMRAGMVAIQRARHPWIRNSHAYGEPGGALGLLGLNLAAPEVFREILPQYAWWFSLAWEPGYGLRFTTPHMGAPYMGEDDLINAAYALVLQGPARSLHLTGGQARGVWKEAFQTLAPSPATARRAD